MAKEAQWLLLTFICQAPCWRHSHTLLFNLLNNKVGGDYPYFIVAKTETEKLSNFSKVTQPIPRRMRFELYQLPKPIVHFHPHHVASVTQPKTWSQGELMHRAQSTCLCHMSWCTERRAHAYVTCPQSRDRKNHTLLGSLSFFLWFQIAALMLLYLVGWNKWINVLRIKAAKFLHGGEGIYKYGKGD